MLTRIYAIARNTLFETIRQPVFCVVLLGALCLIALSPAFTMFAVVSHIKLVKDMGLATILIAGLLLSVLAASSVISDEIRKQTVLTVVSKPVDRFEFILGKHLGILAGLVLAGYLMVIVLTMTVRVGVPATAGTPLDMFAISGMVVALLLALLGALIANYFFDRPFPSAAIVMAALTFSLAFVAVGFLPAVERSLMETAFHYDRSVALGGGTVVMAVTVIASVAVAASTRLNPLLTLGACIAFFTLGLLSNYLLGRPAEGSSIARFAYCAVFNIQAFWLADPVASGRSIPLEYVARAAAYALSYQAAVLCLGMALFQDREVGR